MATEREVNEGTTVTVLGRVLGVTQTPITPISVASCIRRVVNLGLDGSSPVVVEEGAEIVVADSVFDPLRMNEGWKWPGAGWNFRDRFVATSVGRNLIEYTFLDTNDRPSVWTEIIRVIAVP